MIKILICILLIGEIQFVHKKGTNNDGVQVKNTEFVENGIQILDNKTHNTNKQIDLNELIKNLMFRHSLCLFEMIENISN